MKYWFLLLTIALTGFARTNQKACTGKNYFVKTDTTKPYMVKGAYCIAGTKDTIVGGEMGVVSFNVFDRIHRNMVNTGVTWFHHGVDTLEVLFNNGSASQVLPQGEYTIVVSDVNHLALKTKSIRLQKDKEILINFYLGNSLQW